MKTIIWTLVLAMSLATTAASAQELEDQDWWGPRYITDYSLIALGGALGVIFLNVDPVEEAGLGPSFDPDDPAAILDPRESDRIGRTHRPDTISETALFSFAGAGFVVVALLEAIPVVNGLDSFEGQLLHDAAVGYAEALVLTLGVTQMTKVLAGRLRPDFQDRVRLYYCDEPSVPAGIDCAGVPSNGLEDRDTDLRRGRQSFFSGHASISMVSATFVSMVIGGRFVWGDRAQGDPLSIGLGIAAQGALMTFAGFVAASRVDDGRHFASDVMVGSLVGFALAQITYWRLFDTDGLPRGREMTGPSVTLVPGGVGVSWQWTFR